MLPRSPVVLALARREHRPSRSESAYGFWIGRRFWIVRFLQASVRGPVDSQTDSQAPGQPRNSCISAERGIEKVGHYVELWTSMDALWSSFGSEGWGCDSLRARHVPTRTRVASAASNRRRWIVVRTSRLRQGFQRRLTYKIRLALVTSRRPAGAITTLSDEV